jgi:hypothetical protein
MGVCKTCGHDNREGAKYCANCRARMAKGGTAAPDTLHVSGTWIGLLVGLGVDALIFWAQPLDFQSPYTGPFGWLVLAAYFVTWPILGALLGRMAELKWLYSKDVSDYYAQFPRRQSKPSTDDEEQAPPQEEGPWLGRRFSSMAPKGPLPFLSFMSIRRRVSSCEKCGRIVPRSKTLGQRPAICPYCQAKVTE